MKTLLSNSSSFLLMMIMMRTTNELRDDDHHKNYCIEICWRDLCWDSSSKKWVKQGKSVDEECTWRSTERERSRNVKNSSRQYSKDNGLGFDSIDNLIIGFRFACFFFISSRIFLPHFPYLNRDIFIHLLLRWQVIFLWILFNEVDDRDAEKKRVKWKDCIWIETIFLWRSQR